MIGNEERGLQHLVRERCDILLKIDGTPEGRIIDSLNASVAAAIAIYEISK